jgi:uncharacterized membrane protein YcaP (DUF421 family)
MPTFAASISGSLLDHGIPIAEKVVRTVVVYFAIVILLRVFGKRELAQLNSFDLVVLLLLSNVVQNAIIGPDNTLVGGIVGAVTLLGINAIVVRVVRRNPELDNLFEGHQTVIVEHGRLDERAVMRLGLRRGDVLNALRRQGATDLDQVRRASIFPGGAIVVDFEAGAEPASHADLRRVEEKIDRLLTAAGA